MKKSVMKQKVKFGDYKNFMVNNKAILRSQQSFKSEAHVFTEKDLTQCR